jgi:hypothetical protein
MEVLFGNYDMLNAGEDQPVWLLPAHDKRSARALLASDANTGRLLQMEAPGRGQLSEFDLDSSPASVMDLCCQVMAAQKYRAISKARFFLYLDLAPAGQGGLDLAAQPVGMFAVEDGAAGRCITAGAIPESRLAPANDSRP